MKRTAVLFSLVALVAWLLPLGAFIKPSMEKTACDGKRAFHMCSSMSGKAQAKTVSSAGPAFSNPSGPAKASTGSDSGNEFLVTRDALMETRASNFRSTELPFRIFRLDRPVEHVPLAA